MKDPGALFSIINRLLHRSSWLPLPTHDSPSILEQEFADFFEAKIDTINLQLNSLESSSRSSDMSPDPPSNFLLYSFTSVSESDIIKLMIKQYPIKSCPLDPIPASVFREVYMTMTPTLTAIVNLSLNSALMPTPMKEAMINPILTKTHLDKDTLNNYCPVSNLPFVLKLME